MVYDHFAFGDGSIMEPQTPKEDFPANKSLHSFISVESLHRSVRAIQLIFL